MDESNGYRLSVSGYTGNARKYSTVLGLLFYRTISTSTDSRKKPLENIVGKMRKKKKADTKHFILFPQLFLPYQKEAKKYATFDTSKLSSANAFILDKAKFYML